MTQFTKEVPELFIGMKGKLRGYNFLAELVEIRSDVPYDCTALVWDTYKPTIHKFLTSPRGRYWGLGKNDLDIVEWELKDAKAEEQDDVETECDIGNKELNASLNKIYITQQVGDATLHINIESIEPLIELVCAAATLLNQD